MRPSRFTEEQIIGMLEEQEAGAAMADVCRKHGISSATFYKFNAKYGGMDVSDAHRLKTLEDENAFVESFNGRFRDECLNDMLFSTLVEARSAITSWKEDYNRHRPNSALGNITPAEFALKSTLEKQAA